MNKVRLTLSIAALSLFMLSSPRSFAESDSDGTVVASTGFKGAASVSAAYSSFLSFHMAQKASADAASVRAANAEHVNEIAEGARKPYVQELEKLDTPEARAARDKIQKLEKEEKIKTQAIEIAKNGKSYVETERRVVFEKRPFSGGRPDYQVIEVRNTPVVILPQGATQIPAHLEVSSGYATTYSQHLSPGGGDPWGVRSRGTTTVAPLIKQADPINIKEYEKRLVHIKNELSELKAKFPPAKFAATLDRLSAAGSVREGKFNSESKLFTKAEAAELSMASDEVRSATALSGATAKRLRGFTLGMRTLGTASLGFSAYTFGSAVTALFDKKDAPAVSGGSRDAAQQAGIAEGQSLK